MLTLLSKTVEETKINGRQIKWTLSPPVPAAGAGMVLGGRKTFLHLLCPRNDASCSPAFRPASFHLRPHGSDWWRSHRATLLPPPLHPCPLIPAGVRHLAAAKQQRGEPEGAVYIKKQPQCLWSSTEQDCAISGLCTHVILSLRAKVFRGNWKEWNTH